MKKQLLSLLAILIASIISAQTGFNYKALITDNGNALANQSVSIKFTILENGTTNVYQESLTATTDANGIVSVSIGESATHNGDFNTINWANDQSLKVEINTGSGYQDYGTNPLKYVPTAKYADTAGNVFSGNFNDLTNVPTGLADGDDDTHLTDAQIAAMGYIKNPNDADHSTTNEIQTLSVSGNQLSISSGNTVTLPTGTGGDQWGSQVVQSNSSLSGDGTSAHPLAVNTSSSVFNNWDKNASDDFSGNYDDLSNKPDIFLVDDGSGDAATAYNENIRHGGNIFIGSSFSSAGLGKSSLRINRRVNNEESYGITAVVGGTGSDTHYGGYFEILDAGTGIQYGVRTVIGNSGNGQHNGIFNGLGGSGTGNQYGSHNFIYNAGNGGHYGTLNKLSSSGNGFQYGVRNIINNTGTASHFGTNNELSGAGTGPQFGTENYIGNTGNANHYGTYNHLTQSGNGAQFGVRNNIDNTGVGRHYGIYNDLNSTGTGQQYGIYNKIQNTGDANHYGILNSLSGTGNGEQFGVKNEMPNNGDGFHYGAYNSLSGSGSGAHYSTFNYMSGNGTGLQIGILNRIDNSGNADHSGIMNNLEGTGNGSQFGVKNSISNSGNATHYGTYSTLTGSGTGNKFGVYAQIATTAGGTHYAIYGEAEKTGSYAGYFVGDVFIRDNVAVEAKVTAPDSGDTDMKAYVYGSITANGSTTANGAHSAGFSVSKTATGVYEISFTGTNKPTSSSEYTVMSNMRYGDIGFITVENDGDKFTIKTYNTSGNPSNKAFNFVVYKK